MTIKLVVLHPVPSLNQLFGQTHWHRLREKKTTQGAFAWSLHQCAADSSIPTTYAQSILSTACATLDSYLMTGRKIFNSKLGKGKSNSAHKSEQKLK